MNGQAKLLWAATLLRAGLLPANRRLFATQRQDFATHGVAFVQFAA